LASPIIAARLRSNEQRRYRSYHLRKKYGLSPAKFKALLDAQNGRCAICDALLDPAVPRGDGSVHVDHDHAVGRVRGLLCNRCNPGLGNFRDDPVLLEKAANYLRR